jgi:hypothetical protein
MGLTELQVMYEVLNQGLISPAHVQGVSGGWHTTSDTLHGYALKVASVSDLLEKLKIFFLFFVHGSQK